MIGTSGEGSVPLHVLAARFAWCVDIRDTSGVALVKPFHSSQHQRTYKARVARVPGGHAWCVTNVHTPGKASRQHLERHTALTARAPDVNRTMYLMYIISYPCKYETELLK